MRFLNHKPLREETAKDNGLRVEYYVKMRIFLAVVFAVCFIAISVRLIIISGDGMKTSYLVELEKSVMPVFPKTCVICGQSGGEEPLVQLAIGDEVSQVDFYLYRLVKKPSEGMILNVPAHDTCLKRFRNAFFKLFGMMLLVFAGVYSAGILLKFSHLASFIAALLIAMPFLAVEISKPAPAEFFHGNNTYAIQFSNPHVAEEFARLNNARVTRRVEKLFLSEDSRR